MLVRLFIVVVVLVSAGIAAADPQADYILNCRGCHTPDGGGIPGAAPPFRALGDILQAPGSREYLIRVPGTSQSDLDDARTAALLTWIVRRFGGPRVPADFVPFSAAEVARWRRPPLSDPLRVRRELLQGNWAQGVVERVEHPR